MEKTKHLFTNSWRGFFRTNLVVDLEELLPLQSILLRYCSEFVKITKHNEEDYDYTSRGIRFRYDLQAIVRIIKDDEGNMVEWFPALLGNYGGAIDLNIIDEDLLAELRGKTAYTNWFTNYNDSWLSSYVFDRDICFGQDINSNETTEELDIVGSIINCLPTSQFSFEDKNGKLEIINNQIPQGN